MRVEVPLLSFTKRDAEGRIDFRSPLPCPFNYGSLLSEERSPDGEAIDALDFGARRAFGTVIRGQVAGIALFVDEGLEDPKVLLTSDGKLSQVQRFRVRSFFSLYARLKSLRGDAVFRGLQSR